MTRTLTLILSVIILLTSCASRNPDAAGSGGAEISQSPADSSGRPQFWFPDVGDKVSAGSASIEEIHSTASEVFSGVLEQGAENVKIKLLFGQTLCKVISDGGCPRSAVNSFIDKCRLSSCYMEICLDSRFTDGVGILLTSTEREQDIPADMPDSYNFADGVFDSSLSDFRTYPALENGISLAAYEYDNMSGCISELNGIAKAGAEAALTALDGKTGFFDEHYINSYGTAHAVLCSDENGKWSVNGRYNDPILTREYAERVVKCFDSSAALSKAKNCTVQLMFYMENFVGVSANWSADEKYFATYDAAVWESWKAPCEESYYKKSFLNWSGENGCLKGKNGRLCPVGTYCLATGEPLGVYVEPSIYGVWKSATVGGKSFTEYTAEISDGWTDYSNIRFDISESKLFVYNYGSTDVYDIVKTDDGYNVEYHGAQHGSLSVENGTVTLYLWYHPFTNQNRNLPIVLERAENSEYELPAETYDDYVPPEKLSAEEYAAQDTKEYGLLDLSGERIIGEETGDPNVLSKWREYAAAGGAYTMETYQVGASRLEYSVYSTDGKNGYQRWDLIDHADRSDPDYGWETIYYDGYVYDCGYQQSRYDLRKFDRRANTENDSMYCSLFSSNDWANLHFVKAYKVSIGGVEYIAEEWQMGDLDNGYIVYSINGEIKAFEGSFYGNKVTSTVTRLEKQCDSALVREPDKLTGRVFSDNE